MLDMLADFHFLRPVWLLGIIPCVGLWLSLRRADRLPASWHRVIVPELLEHLVTNRRDTQGPRPLGWLIPLGVLGCVAMAGPTWKLADTPLGPDESALVVAFESSQSMNGRDVGPTRAKRAAFKLKDLLDVRGTGQIGVVAYAGTGHTVMPLTDDDRVVRPYLDALSPDLMPVPGDVPESVVPIIDAMIASTDAPSTILLVTDGVPPAGVEALAALQARTGAELVVYSVGTDRGDPSQEIPPVEKTSLEQLANATDGTVVTLSVGNGDLRRILRVLDRHRRQAAARDDASLWEDAGYYLVFPLALLVLFWFRRGWALRLPAAAVVVLSVSGCADHAFVDLWLTPDQQGRRLFEKGEFGAAGERFTDPMWKGIASYAAGDWQGAIAAFSALETPEGYYNLGNAYAQSRQWITAIQTYDKALALRPTFREARANRDLLQGTLDKMQESVDPEEAAKGPPPTTDEAPVKLREDQLAPDKADPALDAMMRVERQENAEPLSEETLEIWMRRVDTKPADFLAQKFAAQAASEEEP